MDDPLVSRIRAAADSAAASDLPFETALPGFTLVRARRPTTFEGILYEPLACIVLQGRKEAMLGDRPIGFGAGQSLIVSLDMPSAWRVREASPERPYVAVALRLDMDVLRGLDVDVPTGAGAGGAIAAGPSDAAIRDVAGRMVALLDAPEDRPTLWPMLVRELHYRLLRSPHGAMLRALARRDSPASRIARVTARLRRDFRERIVVAELAAVAGMSVSTFHEHFRAVTATTPLQFAKALRLIEARRLLGSGAPVAHAAFDVGYESPAQFSRDYSRRFGRPPRADRAAA